MSATVLVSGGGAAAVSTIKSLRMGGFDGRIISTDADPLSAGLYLADGFRVVPKAKDPEFYPTVKRLIEEERIGVIFPTSGFDIYEFARRKRELEAMGVVVAMSDLDAMTTCANKWEFYLKTQRPSGGAQRDITLRLGRWPPQKPDATAPASARLSRRGSTA